MDFIPFAKIIPAIITKNIIKGNNTKTQERFLYPARQIAFNNQVQKAMYNPFPKNIAPVLGTPHSKGPTQYLLEFPTF